MRIILHKSMLDYEYIPEDEQRVAIIRYTYGSYTLAVAMNIWLFIYLYFNQYIDNFAI